MTYLTRRYRFSASHRLFHPEFTDEKNDRLYGKCNNPGGHGHNYSLEVTVAGEPDPATGMVINLVDLDAAVQGEILDRFDCAYLNADRDAFGDKVPTAENICLEAYRLLQGRFGDVRLARIGLDETSRNRFEYRGEGREGI